MSETNKKAFIFLALCFLINWSLVFFYDMAGGSWDNTGRTVISIIYMFIPMLSVIIVQKLVYKDELKKSMAISFKFNKWFLFAWIIPLLISLITIPVSLLIPGISFSSSMEGMFSRFQDILSPEQLKEMKESIAQLPVHPFFLILIQSLVAGFTVNAFAAFGEELGWRGFLQRQWNHLGFLPCSLLIGFFWGIWHAPLILHGHNYPLHPVSGVFMMTAFTLLISPIISFVRLMSKSVIAAAIFHGSLNAVSGLSILLISGGNDLLTGLTGLAGFIVLLIFNFWVLLFIKAYKTEISKSVYTDY